MRLKGKLQNLNGWQRLFVVLVGSYSVVLIFVYIGIVTNEKAQLNNMKKAVLLTVLDKISPLPQVPQDNVAAFFNALDHSDTKNPGKTVYYTPQRTNLTTEQSEAVNKLGHKSYLLRVAGKSSSSFIKEINQLEDYDREWFYFLSLSVPTLLLAWLVPNSLVYLLGFLTVWIYQGFKKKLP